MLDPGEARPSQHRAFPATPTRRDAAIAEEAQVSKERAMRLATEHDRISNVIATLRAWRSSDVATACAIFAARREAAAASAATVDNAASRTSAPVAGGVRLGRSLFDADAIRSVTSTFLAELPKEWRDTVLTARYVPTAASDDNTLNKAMPCAWDGGAALATSCKGASNGMRAGYTLLHAAAFHGAAAACTALIGAGANVDASCLLAGDTPLHVATRCAMSTQQEWKKLLRLALQSKKTTDRSIVKAQIDGPGGLAHCEELRHRRWAVVRALLAGDGQRPNKRLERALDCVTHERDVYFGRSGGAYSVFDRGENPMYGPEGFTCANTVGALVASTGRAAADTVAQFSTVALRGSGAAIVIAMRLHRAAMTSLVIPNPAPVLDVGGDLSSDVIHLVGAQQRECDVRLLRGRTALLARFTAPCAADGAVRSSGSSAGGDASDFAPPTKAELKAQAGAAADVAIFALMQVGVGARRFCFHCAAPPYRLCASALRAQRKMLVKFVGALRIDALHDVIRASSGPRVVPLMGGNEINGKMLRATAVAPPSWQLTLTVGDAPDAPLLAHVPKLSVRLNSTRALDCAYALELSKSAASGVVDAALRRATLSGRTMRGKITASFAGMRDSEHPAFSPQPQRFSSSFASRAPLPRGGGGGGGGEARSPARVYIGGIAAGSPHVAGRGRVPAAYWTAGHVTGLDHKSTLLFKRKWEELMKESFRCARRAATPAVAANAVWPFPTATPSLYAAAEDAKGRKAALATLGIQKRPAMALSSAEVGDLEKKFGRKKQFLDVAVRYALGSLAPCFAYSPRRSTGRLNAGKSVMWRARQFLRYLGTVDLLRCTESCRLLMHESRSIVRQPLYNTIAVFVRQRTVLLVASGPRTGEQIAAVVGVPLSLFDATNADTSGPSTVGGAVEIGQRLLIGGLASGELHAADKTREIRYTPGATHKVVLWWAPPSSPCAVFNDSRDELMPSSSRYHALTDLVGVEVSFVDAIAKVAVGEVAAQFRLPLPASAADATRGGQRIIMARAVNLSKGA